MLLAREFGWTWEYIDEEMTMKRMDAISTQWEQVPPLMVSVAGILQALTGGKALKSRVKDREGQDPQALFDLLGGAGFATEKPEWLKTASQ